MSTFEKIRKAALARLDAGEPVDIILQDYADYEDELRPVLAQATGKSIPEGAQSKRKHKNEESNTSLVPLLMAVGVILLAFLAVGAFILVPTTSDDFIVQNIVQAECVGIPQAQITSGFALQDQNQQVIANRADETVGLDVESVRETSGEEVALGAPADMGAGGGMATSMVVAATSAPLGTITTADMSEPMEEAESSDDRVRTEAYDEADSDGYTGDIAVAPPAPEVPRPTANNVSNEPLRAGEIDDNAEWDDYQDFRNNFLDEHGSRSVRDVDTTGRQIIRVVDNAGNPVLNACVEIYNGESRITSSVTYATGMTMFFPNLNDSTRYVDTFRVVVSKNNVSNEAILDRDVVGAVTLIELDITQQYERVQLDVMFLLDATGSMGDEIAQLQGNILTISDQIDALPNDVDVRYGLVTYRDRGDQYVTRVHEFTNNVADFQDNLLNVVAAGGGDYPESMNEGLDMALNAVDWREGDTVRLMFLVADAPPQVRYQDDADYSLLMQDALARGIKIHQIASGGLQPEGEFVMRQIGQFTMGRFLFLTYEDGVVGTAGDDRTDLEVGDPEDEQGVGDYSVSQLDELVLRLITDEIEALRAE